MLKNYRQRYILISISDTSAAVSYTHLDVYKRQALDDYTKQKKAGIKNPIFNASNIKGLENVECWNDNKFSKEVI